ncbi:clathrin light chain-like isoform X7 [Eriocheir sinensis]|uniref:clathrin light chain-like isoform X7 n=1 Tax=Eriocheir sinensis TaxID=95602 RepID=UPI0021CA6866|nr:clathrin light chain-like isoform X7 [Eriocheir sinensis]
MDGFGDSFVPPVDGNAGEVDPAAEFLAREQDQLAGLDDDIIPPAASAAAPAQTDGSSPSPAPAAPGLEADLFGAAPMNGGPDLESFEMLGGDEVSQDASATETSPARPMAYSPIPHVTREEPEKIKIWRQQQEVRLEEKDAAEELAKADLKQKAQKELEDWYKQHEEQVAKTRQANRDASKSAEKELVADIGKMEPGTEWERIAKLCNFNPKTSKSSRDISRMRSIILQVKQNPPLKA